MSILTCGIRCEITNNADKNVRQDVQACDFKDGFEEASFLLLITTRRRWFIFFPLGSGLRISLDAPKTYIKLMKALLSSVFHLLDVHVLFSTRYPLDLLRGFYLFSNFQRRSLLAVLLRKLCEYLDACDGDISFICLKEYVDIRANTIEAP